MRFRTPNPSVIGAGKIPSSTEIDRRSCLPSYAAVMGIIDCSERIRRHVGLHELRGKDAILVIRREKLGNSQRFHPAPMKFRPERQLLYLPVSSGVLRHKKKSWAGALQIAPNPADGCILKCDRAGTKKEWLLCKKLGLRPRLIERKNISSVVLTLCQVAPPSSVSYKLAELEFIVKTELTTSQPLWASGNDSEMSEICRIWDKPLLLHERPPSLV